MDWMINGTSGGKGDKVGTITDEMIDAWWAENPDELYLEQKIIEYITANDPRPLHFELMQYNPGFSPRVYWTQFHFACDGSDRG